MPTVEVIDSSIAYTKTGEGAGTLLLRRPEIGIGLFGVPGIGQELTEHQVTDLQRGVHPFHQTMHLRGQVRAALRADDGAP